MSTVEAIARPRRNGERRRAPTASISKESPAITVFFFNDTATTEIYTLSLHDALPIYRGQAGAGRRHPLHRRAGPRTAARSEEHTSELQSPCNHECRLLLEKKQGHDAMEKDGERQRRPSRRSRQR